jgi:hypothetical protein
MVMTAFIGVNMNHPMVEQRSTLTSSGGISSTAFGVKV